MIIVFLVSYDKRGKLWKFYAGFWVIVNKILVFSWEK